MKMNMQETDYDQFMANEVRPPRGPCLSWGVQTSKMDGWKGRSVARLARSIDLAITTPTTKQTRVTPASFRDRALHKLVQEINFLKAQAVEPLSTFLDYITCVSASWTDGSSHGLARLLPVM